VSVNRDRTSAVAFATPVGRILMPNDGHSNRRRAVLNRRGPVKAGAGRSDRCADRCNRSQM
jgi:hypothetical protein